MADLDEQWENEFSVKLPKSPRQKIAESMVPELTAYHQYAVLTAIAEKRRLTNEETLQLAYDDAMQTLAYLHHIARYEYEASHVPTFSNSQNS